MPAAIGGQLPDRPLLLIFGHLEDFSSTLNASQVCRRWRELIIDNDDLFERPASNLSRLLLHQDVDRTDDRRLDPHRGMWYNCCIRHLQANRVLNRAKLQLVQLEDFKKPHIHQFPDTFDVVDRELKTDDKMWRSMDPQTTVGRSSGCIYTLHSDEGYKATLDIYNGLYSVEKVPSNRPPSEFNIGAFKNGDLLLNALKFDNEDFYLGLKTIVVGNDRYTYRRLQQDDEQEVFLLEPHTTLTRATGSNQLPYVFVFVKGGQITHKYLMKTQVPPLKLTSQPIVHYDFTMFSAKFYVTIRQERITCYSIPKNEQICQFDVLKRTSTLLYSNVHSRRTYAIAGTSLLCFDEPTATLFSAQLEAPRPKWHPVLRLESDRDDRPKFWLSDVEFTGRFVQLQGFGDTKNDTMFTILLDLYTGDVRTYGIGDINSANAAAEEINKTRVKSSKTKKSTKTTNSNGGKANNVDNSNKLSIAASWVVDCNGQVVYFSNGMLHMMKNNYIKDKCSGAVPLSKVTVK